MTASPRADRIAFYKKRFSPCRLGEMLRDAADGNMLSGIGPDAAEVEILIAAGADLERYDDTVFWTPLLCAASNGASDIVRMLLEAGARVNARGLGDSSALTEAASNGHFAVVKLLLEHHAAIDQPGPLDRTALIYAARDGHPDIAALLLESGANAALRDHDGKTALDHAAENGLKAVAEVFVNFETAQENARRQAIASQVDANIALKKPLRVSQIRPKNPRPRR